MAGRSKTDTGEKSNSPAVLSTKENRNPKLGDIVLYAHRTRGSFELVPMIVTKLYQGEDLIDGAVFSADQYIMPNNTPSKVIREVQQGTSEGTWQHRP